MNPTDDGSHTVPIATGRCVNTDKAFEKVQEFITRLVSSEHVGLIDVIL